MMCQGQLGFSSKWAMFTPNGFQTEMLIIFFAAKKSKQIRLN